MMIFALGYLLDIAYCGAVFSSAAREIGHEYNLQTRQAYNHALQSEITQDYLKYVHQHDLYIQVPVPAKSCSLTKIDELKESEVFLGSSYCLGISVKKSFIKERRKMELFLAELDDEDVTLEVKRHLMMIIVLSSRSSSFVAPGHRIYSTVFEAADRYDIVLEFKLLDGRKFVGDHWRFKVVVGPKQGSRDRQVSIFESRQFALTYQPGLYNPFLMKSFGGPQLSRLFNGQVAFQSSSQFQEAMSPQFTLSKENLNIAMKQMKKTAKVISRTWIGKITNHEHHTEVYDKVAKRTRKIAFEISAAHYGKETLYWLWIVFSTVSDFLNGLDNSNGVEIRWLNEYFLSDSPKFAIRYLFLRLFRAEPRGYISAATDVAYLRSLYVHLRSTGLVTQLNYDEFEKEIIKQMRFEIHFLVYGALHFIVQDVKNEKDILNLYGVSFDAIADTLRWAMSLE